MMGEERRRRGDRERAQEQGKALKDKVDEDTTVDSTRLPFHQMVPSSLVRLESPLVRTLRKEDSALLQKVWFKEKEYLEAEFTQHVFLCDKLVFNLITWCFRSPRMWLLTRGTMM